MGSLNDNSKWKYLYSSGCFFFKGDYDVYTPFGKIDAIWNNVRLGCISTKDEERREALFTSSIQHCDQVDKVGNSVRQACSVPNFRDETIFDMANEATLLCCNADTEVVLLYGKGIMMEKRLLFL